MNVCRESVVVDEISQQLVPPVADCMEMVGARGFEPPTTATPLRCATRLRYAPSNTSDQVTIAGVPKYLQVPLLPDCRVSCLVLYCSFVFLLGVDY